MNPALWGAMCALSLGTADFAARFSSRALGADVVLLGVFGISSVLLTGWIWFGGVPLVWDAAGVWLLIVNGVSMTVMTVLLYAALARGPVSVVAPIVASHPALVLAAWYFLGVRPLPYQWVAMVVTMVGAVVVAASAEQVEARSKSVSPHLRLTLLMAGAACLIYSVTVMTGQLAVPIYGELQTLWLVRLVGLLCIVMLLAARRRRVCVSGRWWLFLGVQACLDAGGYWFLFLGSRGPGSEIAAVTASAFGAVTTVLARVVLKEQMSAVQWLGILLVFGGIVVLAY